MTKVGIITLNGYNNYGNRLQNLALQTFFEELGVESETLIYHTVDKSNAFQKMIRHLDQGNFVKSLSRKVRSKTNRQKQAETNRLLKKREATFLEFSKKYINESSINYNQDLLEDSKVINELNNKFDSFFVGSDQVWHLDIGATFPTNYFMPFVPQYKRNSFSASFGFSEFPSKKIALKYKKAFLSMNKISVREDAGRDLVSSVCNKEATVLFDPTLLLSSTAWGNLSESVDHPKKYLVTYFLGKVTQEYEEIIKRISSENDLEIIRLNDINNPDYFEIPPSQFLFLIKNAQFVLTDSFHGSVFSIIFEVPFVALNRLGSSVDMSSRLVTLLNNFQISERFCKTSSDFMSLGDSYKELSFESSKQIIANNRVKSEQFVQEALAVPNNLE